MSTVRLFLVSAIAALLLYPMISTGFPLEEQERLSEMTTEERVNAFASMDTETIQAYESQFTDGNPEARFYIRRLLSGRLLLVKHGERIDTFDQQEEGAQWNRGRSKLTAWLSDDDGETWQGGLMLDERDHISYPDGTQAPDGTIYLSYDRERTRLAARRT